MATKPLQRILSYALTASIILLFVGAALPPLAPDDPLASLARPLTTIGSITSLVEATVLAVTYARDDAPDT